jgi:hypothetical protein
MRWDEGLRQLAAYWFGDIDTFVFPWGEASVTLEDVIVHRPSCLARANHCRRAGAKGVLSQDKRWEYLH